MIITKKGVIRMLKSGIFLIVLILALAVIAAAQVEVTVNQGVSREKVEIGDDVTVTLSLTNSGSASTEVSIVAVLPSGVSGTNPISGIRDATGNMNVWSGSLMPKETKSLTFIVRANEEGHKTIFSTIKYSDGDAERKIQLTSELSVGKPKDTNIDSDSDGWSDEKEKMMGTNPYSRDSDGDGIADPADPNPLVPEKKMPGFTSLAFLTGLGVGFLIAKKR